MNTFRLPLRAVITLMALFCLNACKEKLEETVAPNPAAVTGSDSAGVFSIEQAYPGQAGIQKKGTLFGQPISYTEINGQAVFQGDIILTPEQLTSGGNAEGDPGGRISGAGRTNTARRWRNFTIPYTIDPNLPNKARVTNAIAHWEDRTPLRFVVRTNQADYITFQPGAGCDSDLGRIGGQQFINLAPGCNTGATIHEIGHAVGLFHEQSRSDRDNYITVKYANIQKDEWPQFDTYQDKGIAGFDFGTFDFNSVMLYPSFNDFAIDQKKPTMIRKDGSTWTVQQNALSTEDRRTVISMYANVYIVWHGQLYAVNVSTGEYASLSSGWEGTSKTIAEDNEFIWAIQNGSLFRANRFNGDSKYFGAGWGGAIGVTGLDPNGNMYAVQNTHLWKIDRNGQRTMLGSAKDDWTETQALFYHNGYLYIVWKGGLYKVSPQTGKTVKYLGNGWGNSTFPVKGIAAARGSATDLYIVWFGSLYRVNTDTGAYKRVASGSFPETAGIVGVAGKLYIVSDGSLYEVDENGNKRFLSGGWQGTESMGVMRNPGLL